MLRLRLKASRWLKPRVMFSIALALLFACLSVGVMPSPAWIIGRLEETAERYPCEDCSCGCASARECWTHCCCHSMPERIVWATRNGLSIPEYVRPSEDDLRIAGRLLAGGGGDCELCHAQPSPEDGSCGTKPGQRYSLGPSLSPLGCKGISPMVVVATVVATPSRVVIGEASACIDRLPWPAELAGDSRVLEAPEPPPRRALVG